MTTQSRISLMGMSLAFMAAFAAAPATGQSVKVKSDPNRDISKLSKYAWKPNQIAAAQKPEVVAQMDQTIKDAVNRELKQKGYIEDPQNPDFFIQVSGYGVPDMGTSANPDVTNPTGANIFTSQSPGGPGVSVWMTVVSHVSFTVTDRSSNEAAWQADVSKKYKDPQKAIKNLDKEIGSVVNKALKDLPAHK